MNKKHVTSTGGKEKFRLTGNASKIQKYSLMHLFKYIYTVRLYEIIMKINY